MPRRRDICYCSSTLRRIRGKSIGLSSGGSYDLLEFIHTSAEEPRRPYLYMYAHSNELEEVGIISLTGVKVEHNTDMEMLFGVRLQGPCYASFVLKGHSRFRNDSPLHSLPPQTRTRSRHPMKKNSGTGSRN